MRFQSTANHISKRFGCWIEGWHPDELSNLNHMSVSLLKLLFATPLASMAIPPSWFLVFLKINPWSANRQRTFNKFSPGCVSVCKEHQEEHVQNHENGEHKELGRLVKSLCGGNDDDNDVAKGDSEQPGGLHHRLHGVRCLAVGELQPCAGVNDMLFCLILI